MYIFLSETCNIDKFTIKSNFSDNWDSFFCLFWPFFSFKTMTFFTLYLIWSPKFFFWRFIEFTFSCLFPVIFKVSQEKIRKINKSYVKLFEIYLPPYSIHECFGPKYWEIYNFIGEKYRRNQSLLLILTICKQKSSISQELANQ